MCGSLYIFLILGDYVWVRRRATTADINCGWWQSDCEVCCLLGLVHVRRCGGSSSRPADFDLVVALFLPALLSSQIVI